MSVVAPTEGSAVKQPQPADRFAGIVRPYSAKDVERLRGSIRIEHTLARLGAERLWRLMTEGPYVHALGAVTGNQAMQMARAGLKAIYCSGWQVAADANLQGQTYPDQSLYPANSVPALVKRLNQALQRADQIEHAEGGAKRHWFAPIVADAEAGFGGPLNAFELMHRPDEEVKVARITAFVIGAIAMAIAIGLGKAANVAFLVALAFAVAASANLPVLVLTIFWKRFNTMGACWGLGAGLLASLGLIVIGPSIMGIDGPDSKVQHLIQMAPIFPLENPGILSIPLGFLGAILGTLLSNEKTSEAKYKELHVRANTGLGAEKASSH